MNDEGAVLLDEVTADDDDDDDGSTTQGESWIVWRIHHAYTEHIRERVMLSHGKDGTM
jgi:hypothetical protein